MTDKTNDSDYILIPLTEISDEARQIAVAWIDNYQPFTAGLPIQQKHKLASDIMHYARIENNDLRQQLAAKDKEIAELKEALHKIVTSGKKILRKLGKEHLNSQNPKPQQP